MANKTVKCRYKHCKHSSRDIPREDAVKVGNSYMHPDCAKTSRLLVEIRDFYYEYVSKTVVMKTLMATINNIVFQKGVDPEYLMFVLNYAVIHKMTIRSPYGLHYLIDNSRIKSEWKKREDQKVIKSAMMDSNEGKVPTSTFTYTPNANAGFGGIIRK